MKEFNMPQGSQEWYEIRLGKVTSSRIKKAFAADNLKLVDELIAERELGYSETDDDYVSDDMQRGKDLEPIAADEYSKLKGIELDCIGFCISDKYDWLGLSPDRFTKDRTGGLEIKSPRGKGHVRYIRMGGLPNDHKHQIYNYFLVNEKLEWLDFVSFCPNWTRKPLYIYRVNRTDIAAELVTIEAELVKFHEKFKKYESQILFA